jgi:hypothetical protein
VEHRLSLGFTLKKGHARLRTLIGGLEAELATQALAAALPGLAVAHAAAHDAPGTFIAEYRCAAKWSLLLLLLPRQEARRHVQCGRTGAGRVAFGELTAHQSKLACSLCRAFSGMLDGIDVRQEHVPLLQACAPVAWARAHQARLLDRRWIGQKFETL